MGIVRKDATITNTGADEDFPGTFEVVLSAPTKDRDGDTLLPEDWKTPLPDHITFDQDHLMSVAGTVGSGVPRIDEKSGQLVVSGTYSSLARAQEVRTLVNEGHIRTTSVAFMSEKSQKDGVTVTKRELLNGAFVAIPSNREALVLSSKGVKAGARNSAADAEKIQGIHDHAAALGADCAAAKSYRQRATAAKSIAGSLEATQDRVRDALQDANPGAWCWLRGTVPDGNGGGYVVFELENSETYDCDTLKQSYTDDGSVVTLTGDPVPVDVMETVTPDPDEVASDASGTDPAPAAGAPEAPAAGAKSAPVDDEPSTDISTRAARLRMLQHLIED
jgi:hypothetical protein